MVRRTSIFSRLTLMSVSPLLMLHLLDLEAYLSANGADVYLIKIPWKSLFSWNLRRHTWTSAKLESKLKDNEVFSRAKSNPNLLFGLAIIHSSFIVIQPIALLPSSFFSWYHLRLFPCVLVPEKVSISSPSGRGLQSFLLGKPMMELMTRVIRLRSLDQS